LYLYPLYLNQSLVEEQHITFTTSFLIKTNTNGNVTTINLNVSYQIAAVSVRGSRVGMEVPSKKALINVRASFGLCRGTSCPAPLTLTNVSPAYSWVHPLICQCQCNEVNAK
jgi:hypothetical protein